jgi:hypothetical protein
MNKSENDPAFARLFDGFEAEMAYRVLVPGADAARRAAYFRSRRNSRVLTTCTTVAALGIGSGITWTVAGGGPQTLSPAGPPPATLAKPASPAPDGRPSPAASPKVGDLSLTAPAELRLKKAAAGGFAGKVTFTVRIDGPPAISSLTTVYDIGNSLEFDHNVESSGLNTCVLDGGPTSWRCSIEGQLAVGSSRSYDLNLWSGVSATGSDQAFDLKISVRLFDGGVRPLSQDRTPENNSATVRVIVPAA